MATDDNGHEYEEDSYLVRAYRLRCECGTVLEIDTKEFKGKMKTRDCGCGAAGLSGEHVIMAFSTPSGVKRRVQEIARDNGLNVSQWITAAITREIKRQETGG